MKQLIRVNKELWRIQQPPILLAISVTVIFYVHYTSHGTNSFMSHCYIQISEIDLQGNNIKSSQQSSRVFDSVNSKQILTYGIQESVEC